MSALRRQVFESIEGNQPLAVDVASQFDKVLTTGERVADKVAAFGGSWTFIGIFAGIIFCWMTVNSAWLVHKPFDPYPFILLNLVLSCLAALQAPVIMMSQNRAAIHDRMQADNDYKVNLKAELEIRIINEKVDRLLNDQWKHLMEIQEMQMEMINELVKSTSSLNESKP